MTDCIFCKIKDKEIPSRIVFENDDTLAFFDSTQTTPGHTLLIPKKHVDNIMEYDEDLAKSVFSVLPQIVRGIKNYHPDVLGVNILNNNGKAAYQSVFHSHIHIIPRFGPDDGFAIKMVNHSKDYSDQDLDELASQVKASIKGEL